MNQRTSHDRAKQSSSRISHISPTVSHSTAGRPHVLAALVGHSVCRRSFLLVLKLPYDLRCQSGKREAPRFALQKPCKSDREQDLLLLSLSQPALVTKDSSSRCLMRLPTAGRSRQYNLPAEAFA